jgi:hypothetical protein
VDGQSLLLGSCTNHKECSTVFYFEIVETIQFLVKIIQKIKFCASFQFHFLRIFLVSENLLYQYEQLLLLTHIGASILDHTHMGAIFICLSKA